PPRPPSPTPFPYTTLFRSRPFGSRRVLHVAPMEGAADLRQRGIEYVLVNAETWSRLARQTLESWLAGNNAEVVERFSITLRATGDRKSTRLNSSHLGISYA